MGGRDGRSRGGKGEGRAGASPRAAKASTRDGRPAEGGGNRCRAHFPRGREFWAERARLTFPRSPCAHSKSAESNGVDTRYTGKEKDICFEVDPSRPGRNASPCCHYPWCLVHSRGWQAGLGLFALPCTLVQFAARLYDLVNTSDFVPSTQMQSCFCPLRHAVCDASSPLPFKSNPVESFDGHVGQNNLVLLEPVARVSSIAVCQGSAPSDVRCVLSSSLLWRQSRAAGSSFVTISICRTQSDLTDNRQCSEPFVASATLRSGLQAKPGQASCSVFRALQTDTTSARSVRQRLATVEPTILKYHGCHHSSLDLQVRGL